jgi:hypothetical protein
VRDRDLPRLAVLGKQGDMLLDRIGNQVRR